ncbi:MAG: hypothetical protein EA401_10190 [Planctomycetota bacterium]|nr:MAG: hypothetical protein EA401_10190 [Planctomycetota bacterium]
MGKKAKQAEKQAKKAAKNKKLTPAQKRARKAARAERRQKYQTVMLNGKQVRIRRPPTVDGIPVDEFIARNADPIWLHEHEMWELMPQDDPPYHPKPDTWPTTRVDDDDEPPF